MRSDVVQHSILLPTGSTVQIGSHVYTIKLSEHVADDGNWGEVNYRTEEISINPRRPQGQRACTLIHEILHVISITFCADLKERQVKVVSEGLSQALQSLGIQIEIIEAT